MNDIITKNYNKNSKGQYHGYQEWYNNSKLIYKGNYINNNMIGYSEYHWCKIIIYYI